ncbi:MAG: hypothetical protein R3B53_01585 [Candidatus Paceibacterota bacterium]
MQPKKLEHYKYFQPIAWTLCISFAGFVGLLALNLKVVVQDLESSNMSFETRLQNVEEIVGVNPSTATAATKVQ